MESPEILTLSRISGARYVGADGANSLELRLSRWRYRGVASIGAQTYELRRTGILDRGVAVVGPDGADLLCLSRKHPNVPGLTGCAFRVRSRLRGYEARLTRAGAVELVVTTGQGSRSDVRAEISGTLPGRELVVLAAAFAVLMRRLEDAEAGGAAVAAVAATS
jgi:hypothetical protein